MQPNGILLIDEIENGFYFDRLQSIWSLILRFASEYNVQIFASTHSRECLEAAADVGKNQRDKFGIIRTVKVKGTVEIRQFDGRRFVDAMDEGIEIR
jgi:AAA15 family ATPase/GTPase